MLSSRDLVTLQGSKVRLTVAGEVFACVWRSLECKTQIYEKHTRVRLSKYVKKRWEKKTVHLYIQLPTHQLPTQTPESARVRRMQCQNPTYSSRSRHL